MAVYNRPTNRNGIEYLLGKTPCVCSHTRERLGAQYTNNKKGGLIEESSAHATPAEPARGGGMRKSAPPRYRWPVASSASRIIRYDVLWQRRMFDPLLTSKREIMDQSSSSDD